MPLHNSLQCSDTFKNQNCMNVICTEEDTDLDVYFENNDRLWCCNPQCVSYPLNCILLPKLTRIIHVSPIIKTSYPSKT